MTIEYLKKAAKTPATGEDETREIVATLLSEIEAGGEDKAREYGEKLDGREADIDRIEKIRLSRPVTGP